MTKTLYRTTYTFVVLSEEPIPPTSSFADVLDETETGEYLGMVASDDDGATIRTVQTVTGKDAAEACREFGSDPGFFEMDDDGVSDDEDDE